MRSLTVNQFCHLIIPSLGKRVILRTHVYDISISQGEGGNRIAVVVTIDEPDVILWKAITSDVEYRIRDRNGDAHGNQEAVLYEIRELVKEMLRADIWWWVQ